MNWLKKNWWILAVFIAGLLIGGIGSAKGDLVLAGAVRDVFRLDARTDLEERADKLAHTLAERQIREAIYRTEILSRGEQIRSLETELAEAEARESATRESLARTTGLLAEANRSVGTGEAAAREGFEASRRLDGILREAEDTVRRLQGDDGTASGDS